MAPIHSNISSSKTHVAKGTNHISHATGVTAVMVNGDRLAQSIVKRINGKVAATNDKMIEVFETSQAHFGTGTLTNVEARPNGSLALSVVSASHLHTAKEEFASTSKTIPYSWINNEWSLNTTSGIITAQGGNASADVTFSIDVPAGMTNPYFNFYMQIDEKAGARVFVNGVQVKAYLKTSSGVWVGTQDFALVAGRVNEVVILANAANITGGGYDTVRIEEFNTGYYDIQYQTSGTRELAPIDLSSLVAAYSSVMTWSATPNGGTVQIQTSLDEGATWQTAINGQSIPGITENTPVTGKNLRVRQILTSPDHARTPSIEQMFLQVVQQLGIRYTLTTHVSPIGGATSVAKLRSARANVTSTVKPIKSSVVRLGDGDRSAYTHLQVIEGGVNRQGLGSRVDVSYTSPVTGTAFRVGSGSRDTQSHTEAIHSTGSHSVTRTLTPTGYLDVLTGHASRVGNGLRTESGFVAPIETHAIGAGLRVLNTLASIEGIYTSSEIHRLKNLLATSHGKPIMSDALRAGSGSRQTESYVATIAAHAVWEFLRAMTERPSSHVSPINGHASRSGFGARTEVSFVSSVNAKTKPSQTFTQAPMSHTSNVHADVLIARIRAIASISHTGHVLGLSESRWAQLVVQLTSHMKEIHSKYELADELQIIVSAMERHLVELVVTENQSALTANQHIVITNFTEQLVDLIVTESGTKVEVS
jgi:hypothetical protein